MSYGPHAAWLEGALEAIRTRAYFAPFAEAPGAPDHAHTTRASADAWFDAVVGRPFEIDGADGALTRWVGDEVSPFTGRPLGIRYAAPTADEAVSRAAAALPSLARAGVAPRVRACLDALARLYRDLMVNAVTTQHTAGQAFPMAFAGSGANSLDRGLEALAYAVRAMAEVPGEATYVRRFGKGEPVHVDKRYRLRPRGVAVVMACASYPAWNAYPAIVANLATGNPVVLKPHPAAILPMARAAQHLRDALEAEGLPRDAVVLAPEAHGAPIGLRLATDPRVEIVDFTGSAGFGAHLVASLPGKLVFTETAGCNAVVLESTDDLDATLTAIAHGLCLFSGQMCTTPQNLHLPRDGVRTPQGLVRAEEVEARLVSAVDRFVAGAEAHQLTGALGAASTLAELDRLASHAASGAARLVRDSAAVPVPGFPEARTRSPLLLGLDADDRELAAREWFGPMGFVIRGRDREASLEAATADARAHGSIANYVYSTDEAFLEAAEDAFAHAGASVGVNLHRHRPIQFTAGYSDYHVTGLNPAGTACLTDAAFVAGRFRITQAKRERS